MARHTVAPITVKVNKMTPKELAHELTNFVNVLNQTSKEHEEFVSAVLNDHRTLQQEVGGLVFKLIKGWADAYDNGQYDARNEYLCKCCKKIVLDHPDMFAYRMPFI